SRLELVTHGPDGRWAYALSSEYDVTLKDGDSTVHFRGTADRPALSHDEHQRALERMESDAQRAGIAVDRLPLWGSGVQASPTVAVLRCRRATLGRTEPARRIAARRRCLGREWQPDPKGTVA